MFKGDVYNGTPYLITELTVSVGTNVGDSAMTFLEYVVEVTIESQTSGSFQFPYVEGEQPGTSWSIVAAKFQPKPPAV